MGLNFQVFIGLESGHGPILHIACIDISSAYPPSETDQKHRNFNFVLVLSVSVIYFKTTLFKIKFRRVLKRNFKVVCKCGDVLCAWPMLNAYCSTFNDLCTKHLKMLTTVSPKYF